MPEQAIPLSDLFPPREYNPWRAPGYYVATSAAPRIDGGPCAHCGAPFADHLGAQQFCPAAPREVCQ